MQQQIKNLISKHSDKFRFILVGGTNTVIDFGILFSLNSAGLDNVVNNLFPLSNIISTSVALIFSFFANKKFTFKDNTNDKTQIIKFLVVTLFGLWIIQTIIIKVVEISLGSINNDKLILLIGKLLATIFSLTWNYILYKKFVFVKK